MNLSTSQLQMLKGERYPYCNRATELIYRTVQGIGMKPFYICKPCDAWVGCHKEKSITVPIPYPKALGRVAKPLLRQLKVDAHHAFDALWRNGNMTRHEAYQWLSEALDLPVEYTHIGMFGIETCKRTIELVTKKLTL